MTDRKNRLKKFRRRRLSGFHRFVIGLISLLVLIIGVGAITFDQQLAILRYKLEAQLANIPSVNAPEPATPEIPPPNEPLSVPPTLNLDVPFTSQAPHANWDAAHEEFCEEASVAMAARFFAGESFTGPDDAEQELQRLKDWQETKFGYFESTTAKETTVMIKENYPLDAKLETDVSVETIKQALAEDKLIILPAAGRELGNPFFTAPGPIYHMLVVKGYTDSKFITNDPGTRQGADYIYDQDTLLAAVGDYNHGDPANGLKVMIVVSSR